LAAVAEEAMERGKEIKVADAIGYLLVRKLLNML
jgi:DNA polymerase elongation subunit (family B)